MKSTVCAFAWLHVRLFQQKKYLPCCNFDGEPQSLKNEANVQEVLENEFFSDLRKKMLNGEKVPGCHKCYQFELGGHQSIRNEVNSIFGPVWEKAPRIQYIELNLGNICNLQCRGCNSESSTKWYADEIKLGLDPYPIMKASTKYLDSILESVKIIKMIGGEPFLAPDHLKILRILKEKASINEMSLIYSTNGTVRVEQEVLDLWSQLHYLEIVFSIDGFKTQNDYFRYGSEWQKVIENIRWFQQNVRCQKLKFTFHTVVNIYNIHNVDEIDDWLEKEFPSFYLQKDYLTGPTHLDARNLPDSEKEMLIVHYREQSQKNHYRTERRECYQFLAHFLAEPGPVGFQEFLEQEEKRNSLWGLSLQDSGSRFIESISYRDYSK